jgi:hypothetical protein
MSKLKCLSILASAAALALFAAANDAAAAEMLALNGPIQGNTVGPQSTSNPCIIAGTACQQPAGFGFDNFNNSGGVSSYNQWSTAIDGGNNGTFVPSNTRGTPYTLGQLRQFDTFGQSSFEIAIDVNTSGAMGETLQSFEVFIGPFGAAPGFTGGTLFASFTGPALIGNIANNGNGFADWTLNNVDFDSLPSTTQVLFHAVYNNASDGAESFFLISVPSPLIGHGLLALLAVGGVLFGGKLVEILKKHRLQAA